MKNLKKIFSSVVIMSVLLMAIPAQTSMAVGEPTVTIIAYDSIGYEVDNPIVFRIYRTGDTTSSLTVNVSWSGTATRGADYTIFDSLTIQPGQAYVEQGHSGGTDDDLPEDTETIIATITPDASYIVGTPSSATAYLYDGEAPATVTVGTTDNSMYESGTNNTVMFRFTRNGDTGADLTVNFTESGTATRAFDYMFTEYDNTIVIPAGETYADLTAWAAADDDLGTETIIVTVAAGDGYTIGNSSSVTATLYDGEDPYGGDGGDDPEYDGEVALDVVQDGDNYVATTEEDFNLIPSGADFGTVSFGYGMTLTANAPWDGTLAASAGEVETPSALGFSEAKSIDITKGDYEGPLQLSDETYVHITYDGFSDFTNPTVKIDRGDTTDTIEHCSDVQWTGTSLSDDIIDNLHLEADTACYIGADDVDDEEEDFVAIGTRHLSEFIAGEGVAEEVNNGGGGGGVVIPREVITETDDNSAETVTTVDSNTSAIDTITNQITSTVEVVKTEAEVKAEEQKNVDKVENDVEDLFVTQNIDQSVLDSVSEVFAGNADADLDGIPNNKDANPMIKDVAIKNVFTNTEDSTVANLKVALVSSNGFILSGTTKANSEVSVKVGENTFKTTADENGHYLIPVELANVEGLFAVETTVNGEVSSMLVKAQKDTIAPPTINLEGKDVSIFKDFTAEDLIEYLKGLNNTWVRNANTLALTAVGNSKYKDIVIANIEVRSDSKNSNVIVKGTAVPGSTVILAYKSVIYSSVVIADKNGKFTASVPKDLAAELTLDKNLSEVSHQIIAFSVDYKTNKVSPFVKDLFKIYK